MTRHKIDRSLSFSLDAYDALPETREVEVPEGEPTSVGVPPTETRAREAYLCGASLEEAVNLAIALGRPLLVQGDPGCGKTRLAWALGFYFGLPLEEFHVKSTSRAQDLLYTFDAVARLYDAQLGARCPTDAAGRPRSDDARNYVHLGPLGRAIARAHRGRRSVVLIDEIDKADLDFPNDLLWELDQLEFSVPEVPGLKYSAGEEPSLRPIVIVTHNDEKPLPAPFLRRCVYHYLEFVADAGFMRRVLALHTDADDGLCERAIDVLLKLRAMDLSKRPGLSELVDWVGYLHAATVAPERLSELPYVGALLKSRDDQLRARRALGAL